MAKRIRIKLSDEKRAELKRAYRQAGDGAFKIRCLMIRLLDRGEIPAAVANTCALSPVKVRRCSYRWDI